MNTLPEIYKLIRWNKPYQFEVLPPLNHNGRFISDRQERAHTLQDALLERYHVTDDLPTCIAPTNEGIPWSDDLSEEEVQACTIRCDNKAPRADGITVELLRVYWDTVTPHVL